MIEKSNMPQREDLDVPKDLACMFYFACDGKFSKILVAGKKRWPDNMTLSEKLSLSEGDFITLKCGPKYNVEAQGEFVLQGSEKHVTRAISKICVLRESGHDVSQIEAQKIFDEVLKKDKPIFPESQDDDDDFVPASPETRGKKYQGCKKMWQFLMTMKLQTNLTLTANFTTNFWNTQRPKRMLGLPQLEKHQSLKNLVPKR